MGLVLVSGNVSPVSVDDLVAHLKLDDLDVQTDLLSAYGAAAGAYVQTETRQQLTPAVYRLSLDTFPDCRVIRLPYPPLQSVTSVKYIDTDGVEQTLSSDAYTVDIANKPGRVVLNELREWPATTNDANAVTVEFSTGYAATPALLKIAILMLAAYWHENREAAVTGTIATELPLAVKTIIEQNAYVEAV